MNTKKLTLPLMLALICGSASADVIPFLGAAQQFAVLGAQSVTNTNATALRGDLGVATARPSPARAASHSLREA
jgi:hypothetical protein